MAELVNWISDASDKWNKHITWIKINVGYILAEAEYIQGSGNNVDDIVQFANHFKSVYSVFLDSEMALYKSIRKMETDHTKATEDSITFCIQNMKGCFIAWLMDMDNIVKERQKGEIDLALGLMQICGAEILNSHTDFLSTMERVEMNLEERIAPNL